jgi:glycosyltransferase involved in cell wall biosynthesis
VKIAFVTPYLPYPLDTGGKIRSYNLLQGLGRSHEVDVYTVHRGDTPEVPPALRASCHSVFSAPIQDGSGSWSRAANALRPFMQTIAHFRSPETLAQIRGRVAAGQYGLLVADELCMTPYLAGLRGRKLAARQKIEHQHHAALAARRPAGPRRLLEAFDLARLRRFERRAMACVDAAVCCSEQDAALLQGLSPSVPVAVVANGVDLDHFRPLAETEGPPTLAFLGTLDYPPNVDALDHFFRAIHPRLLSRLPDVRVSIVGRNPAREVLGHASRPGVSVSGSVPDVRPHLAEAGALVVPLRVGGGTRIKILEALAASRPVVSTTVGAEGLELRDGEHLLIADDPEAFANACARLLEDAALRHRLVAAGRRLVVERYAWSRQGRLFADVCARVAATGEP